MTNGDNNRRARRSGRAPAHKCGRGNRDTLHCESDTYHFALRTCTDLRGRGEGWGGEGRGGRETRSFHLRSGGGKRQSQAPFDFHFLRASPCPVFIMLWPFSLPPPTSEESLWGRLPANLNAIKYAGFPARGRHITIRMTRRSLNPSHVPSVVKHSNIEEAWASLRSSATYIAATCLQHM